MDTSHINIYLVGPMGSGKTSIGQRLARELGLEFCDCDHELEEHTGASINLIFDVEGEEGFRQRETAMLRELSGRCGVVLATGGGAILREENRDLLKGTGLVVYLQTTVQQQLNRLRRDRSRPLLQTEDREQKLNDLARQRDPLYESVADLVFPARNRGLDAAARALAANIREHLSENVT